MTKKLSTVFEYFSYFFYAPSFEEIYTFFPTKISQKNLKILLENEIKDKKILRLPNDRLSRTPQGSFTDNFPAKKQVVYTLPQYSTKIVGNNKRNSDTTLQIYIIFLRLCPLVRFVAVTGKSAMRGLQKNDDVDLCIVAKHNLLWMTRFFIIVAAKILGIHSKKGVCLNLFFDEQDVYIPNKKQNSYIAHEVLQMKKIIDKDHMYEWFLFKNRWISHYFPNAKISSITAHKNRKKNGTFYKYVDSFFRAIQLPIIIRNNAAFLITPTQLWLFQNDFEKKLKQSGLVL